MKHNSTHFVDPATGDIVFRTDVIYTPKDFWQLNGEAYRYASSMVPGGMLPQDNAPKLGERND